MNIQEKENSTGKKKTCIQIYDNLIFYKINEKNEVEANWIIKKKSDVL